MSRQLRIAFLTVVLCIAALLFALQLPSTAIAVGSALPATEDVGIVDFAFSPQTILIPVGTTVRWTNHGPSAHQPASDTAVFDSGPLATNATFDFQFNTVGTFPYHCAIHPFMTGKVIVAQQVFSTYLATINR